MNNTYSIDELSRMSPEEVYGFDPIERDRLLEVQADLDMMADESYLQEILAEQAGERSWEEAAERSGSVPEDPENIWF
jgi:hypothetical protein